jgi:hypothetical protein
MALEFTEQVTVRVWRNIKTAGFMPSSHFGHASVELRASYIPTNDRMQVSFWPGGDGAGKGMSGIRAQASANNDDPLDDKLGEMGLLTSLRLEVGYRQEAGIAYPPEWDGLLRDMGKSPLRTPRPGQKPSSFENADGIPLWSQSQESKIKLPALQHLRGLWGLPIRPIMRWWQTFQAANPSYRALSTNNNCAGVALMALEAGGAGAFLPLPTLFIYAEPTQVERYALGLRSVIEQTEIATNKLILEIDAARKSGLLKPSTGEQKDGLWTMAEWKKQSALGPMQPRSGAIRDIDDALARYHAATWAGDYNKKFTGFVKLVRSIAAHRQDKAASARSAAILALAAQAVALLKGSGPMHQ